LSEEWTILKILKWTTAFFRDRGIENGRLDAELLLAEALGLDRVGLYLNYDRPLTAAELAVFRALVSRRARREPVQYILGRTEFWSLPITVTPAVLIPRPDTETLVEEALKKALPSCAILDIGTGSGAVALALAHDLQDASIEGIDISAEALAVAMANARRNGLENRVAFRQADMRDPGGGPFDLIVANPPYIPDEDFAGLMPEVREFEPRLALAGGADGLDCYRWLATVAVRILRPGGWLLVEIGCGQASHVCNIFNENGMIEFFSAQDAAGKERVAGARRP
jgi:release factor glutamine methyltransferase